MKNLRIDIILPNERRSASPVSLKLISRMAILLVVGVVVIIFGIMGYNVSALKRQQKRLNDEWAIRKPQQTEVEKKKKELPKHIKKK